MEALAALWVLLRGCVEAKMSEAITVRTKKFITNRLLQRRQFVSRRAMLPRTRAVGRSTSPLAATRPDPLPSRPPVPLCPGGGGDPPGPGGRLEVGPEGEAREALRGTRASLRSHGWTAP